MFFGTILFVGNPTTRGRRRQASCQTVGRVWESVSHRVAFGAVGRAVVVRGNLFTNGWSFWRKQELRIRKKLNLHTNAWKRVGRGVGQDAIFGPVLLGGCPAIFWKGRNRSSSGRISNLAIEM